MVNVVMLCRIVTADIACFPPCCGELGNYSRMRVTASLFSTSGTVNLSSILDYDSFFFLVAM